MTDKNIGFIGLGVFMPSACELFKQMEDQGDGLKGTQALFHLFK